MIGASQHKEGNMEKKDGRTARDLIECAYRNIYNLDPRDPNHSKRIQQASECLAALWWLLGFEAKGRCIAGQIPPIG
jgi:hypothetical protein